MRAAADSLIGLFQFSSGPYLVFLAAAVVVYFLLPGPRTRIAWLLSLSLGFYALLSPASVLVLLTVAVIGYLSGASLEAVDDDYRKPILILTVLTFVGALIFFKYLGFFAQLSNQATAAFGLGASIPVIRLALPLGISFWSFQSIAYVVDVYRRKCPAELNPAYYLAAVSFFPVVTAGPITKVQTLIERLSQKHRFDYDEMQSGLLLIGRGFFKKLLIADRLAVFVDAVYKDPQAFGSGEYTILLVASVFFAIQLYCDFSGYTDIVRGSARLFGVDLPINFRTPYFARSVADFWRRWHITLMDWFKEYVYIPLGGNRVSSGRRYFNLLAVFAISGLWHGAGLTYVFWGLLNGSYQIAGRLLGPVNTRIATALGIGEQSRLLVPLQTIWTFVLVTVAWVFFRADSFADAVYVVSRMFVPTVNVFTDGSLLKLGLSSGELLVALGGIALLFVAEWLSQDRDVLGVIRRRPLVLRWALYYALILSIVVFGTYGGVYSAADFVYFKY